jgi:hypothetical protein
MRAQLSVTRPKKKTERQAQKIALRKMLIFGHKNTFEQLTGGKKRSRERNLKRASKSFCRRVAIASSSSSSISSLGQQAWAGVILIS